MCVYLRVHVCVYVCLRVCACTSVATLFRPLRRERREPEIDIKHNKQDRDDDVPLHPHERVRIEGPQARGRRQKRPLRLDQDRGAVAGQELGDDVHHDVAKEEEDDEEEPQVDELDLRRGRQGAGVVREEGVQDQERREGHRRPHIQGLQADEERRPAYQQDEDAGHEGRQHGDPGATVQDEAHEGRGPVGDVAQPHVLHGEEREVGGPSVGRCSFGQSEDGLSLQVGVEFDFDQAELRVEGVVVEGEVAAEGSEEDSCLRERVFRAGEERVWK